jgi:hypothetical protein
MTTKLSEEEHIARAMLLGMRYHHGNGEPFYYKMDATLTIQVSSIIDANTLEPFIQHPVNGIDWHGMIRANDRLKAASQSTTTNRKWKL